MERATADRKRSESRERAPVDIFARVFGVVVQELHRTPPGGYQASDRGRWLGG